MAQIHAVVAGDVQGVNFRYYTVQQAKALGLKGFVRNCPDGSVEVIAQGNKEQLLELIEWLKKGPGFASVSRVSVEWQPEGKQFREFSVEY